MSVSSFDQHVDRQGQIIAMKSVQSVPQRGLAINMFFLLFLLVSFLPQVQLLSWHDAYSSLVFASDRIPSRPRSVKHPKLDWHPSTFGWNKRRQGLFSVKDDSHLADFSDLEYKKLMNRLQSASRDSLRPTDFSTYNHIPTLLRAPQHIFRVQDSSFQYPRSNSLRSLLAASGADSVHETIPDYILSLYYPTPVMSTFAQNTMNRRAEVEKDANLGVLDKDREVMTNIINEAIEEELRPPAAQEKVSSLWASELQVTTALPNNAPLRNYLPHSSLRMENMLMAKTVDKNDSKKLHSSGTLQVSVPSGRFLPDAIPLQKDKMVFDKSETLFKSETGNDRSPFDENGFTSPEIIAVHPSAGTLSRTKVPSPRSLTQTPSELEGFDSFEGGFSDFPPTQVQPADDRPIGFSRSTDPLANGFLPPSGSFDSQNKDCDTIYTRTCTNDSECMCYGFYVCNDGRCQELASPSSNNGEATLSEEWHQNPVDIPGFFRRRRSPLKRNTI